MQEVSDQLETFYSLKYANSLIFSKCYPWTRSALLLYMQIVKPHPDPTASETSKGEANSLILMYTKVLELLGNEP